MTHDRAWRPKRRVTPVLLLALALLVLALPVSAHDDPDGGKGHDDRTPLPNVLPEHATQVMRAFWADRQVAMELDAMSATTCVDGFAGPYPCHNVDLLAFMPLADIGGTFSNSAANDIWGWTDPLTGKEYAIVGRVFGTSFVDISDPVNPVYLGDLPTHGAFGASWRDIKVHADHAFVVSEANQHGMQVFDLTQLRDVQNPPVQFGETAHYNGNAQAHNVAINEDTGFAYIVGASGKNNCSGGLHMVNIQDPANPTFAGCFSADGYTHDTQCVVYEGPDAAYQGREICFNSNEDTLTIVDVTDKSNPVMLSRLPYPGSAYTHQGWLTEDQAHFVLDDELDESNFGHNTRTRVFDVSSLTDPSLVGFHDSTVAAIDHNQYVLGNHTYQANYRAGLRILELTDVTSANLTEVAYFDIYPPDDAAQFNAAWSNYPYFDSGVVIVSGIEQGLFVLLPHLDGEPPGDQLEVSITSPADAAVVSGTISITADASGPEPVSQVEFFVNGASIGVDGDGSDGWSIEWDTTTVDDGQHTITAVATDAASDTDSDSISVTVDNVPTPTMHVGDLDGSTSPANGGRWNAAVTVTVHDAAHEPVSGATVHGTWTPGGGTQCTTGGAGTCTVELNNIHRNTNSVTFEVTDLVHSSHDYEPADNHDPAGATIVLTKP